MKTELGKACRELVELANAAPPGPVRDRMQADLVNLRRRLATMPDRVAEQITMKPREVIETIMDREIKFCFADILQWGHLK
jgi:hypothetical protein